MKPEVVVVGAGPAGGLAARQLARNGHTVLILEEHKKVGHPVHCAGLIGINGLHENGVIPKSQVIIRRVRRSIFHAPSGEQLVLDKGEPHAYVLHRDRLDQQIVKEAEVAGATLQLETRVIRCKREQNGMRVTILERQSKRDLYAQFVVNAEGIRARLAQDQGLPRPKRDYMLPALQYEVTNVSLSPDAVHLYFNSEFARGFFAWIIPLETNHARVGLASAQRQVRQALDKFLIKNQLLSGAKIEKRYGGIVYAGGPASRTIAPRFVNIGDAAGQTKATTGGGVVAGGACAIMAASSISNAFRNCSYNHRDLQMYERRWKRSWGRQLQLMAYLRRFVNTLENHELDQLFAKLQVSKAREVIERRGDIDHQGRLITSALTSPVLLQSVLKLLFLKSRFLPKILLG
ncbi:MAG: geranylgeranyl reductase family protein [Candidatus Hermodarchaeota archaeon]